MSHVFDYPVFAEPQPGDPPICQDCRDLYMDGIYCDKHKDHATNEAFRGVSAWPSKADIF
jgi:hypothetical protein